MKDVGIFYGHLVHFTVFCHILWAFGIAWGNLVYFFPVLGFCTMKTLATPLHSLDAKENIGKNHKKNKIEKLYPE
jgi:hypothetical protein